MEMEVEEHIGAARHERTEGRSGQRNGYRQRAWDTRAATVEGLKARSPVPLWGSTMPQGGPRPPTPVASTRPHGDCQRDLRRCSSEVSRPLPAPDERLQQG